MINIIPKSQKGEYSPMYDVSIDRNMGVFPIYLRNIAISNKG